MTRETAILSGLDSPSPEVRAKVAKYLKGQLTGCYTRAQQRESLGISRATLTRWAKKHPDVFALDKGGEC